MKNRIMNRLKQEYSHLGLDENSLSGLAESLANSGYVTDENIEVVVAGQKAYLESMQRNIDKRVQTAVDKAKGDASKEQAYKIADLEKQLEEAKRTEMKQTPDGDEMPEWYKREREERAKREDELKKQIETLAKAKEDSDREKAEAEAARAASERKQVITKKAKEMGIPEWMCRHGFADIPDDADDSKIEEILNCYAQEIQTHFLPNHRSLGQGSEKSATKAEADAIAAAMLPGRKKSKEE